MREVWFWWFFLNFIRVREDNRSSNFEGVFENIVDKIVEVT
jgi:hypothetical protein